MVGEPHPTAGLIDERFGGRIAEDSAAVDHHDSLAERCHVVGLMRRQQHGVVLGDRRDGLAEPQPLLGIEPRRGFVKHEQLRVSEQCLGDDHPASHPT